VIVVVYVCVCVCACVWGGAGIRGRMFFFFFFLQNKWHRPVQCVAVWCSTVLQVLQSVVAVLLQRVGCDLRIFVSTLQSELQVC